MSRISPTKRKMQIRKRRQRWSKLSGLRQKYQAAKTSFEKEKILEKVPRLSPGLTQEEFLKPLSFSKKADA
ncbi:MAG: hypothetical protein JW991_05020 [Candidatus Pacebacteria bacterium]|nr:hypothetical protein [Candidatus Paceibacterota bacterium]